MACDWSPILLKCVDGFTIQPEDVAAVVGEMVQMDCHYEGDGTAALAWEKDGTSILGDEDRFVHSNGTLQFTSVNTEDVGTYECVVQLGFGDFRRCSAELRLAGELVGGGLRAHVFTHAHNAYLHVHHLCCQKSCATRASVSLWAWDRAGCVNESQICEFIMVNVSGSFELR